MPSPTPSGCGSTNCRSRPTACSRRWRSAVARAMGMRAKHTTGMRDCCDDFCAPVQPVMRGQKRVKDARERAYDPRIHLLRKKVFAKMMDCRVKPGNDEVETV